MKLVKYSTLTEKQKQALITIIGFKDNIPTTYAEKRDSLDWNIMQSKDSGRLAKKQNLITISIQDSLEDVITFFNKNSLTLYCPIDKNADSQLKNQLNERKKDRREQPRKKAILRGEFFNKRTRHSGRLCTVDISLHGVKFTSKLKHDIAVGDNLSINYTLNNNQRSKIEREIKAVYINEKQVGAEIINPPPLDPDLGFYLMQ